MPLRISPSAAQLQLDRLIEDLKPHVSVHEGGSLLDQDPLFIESEETRPGPLSSTRASHPVLSLRPCSTSSTVPRSFQINQPRQLSPTLVELFNNPFPNQTILLHRLQETPILKIIESLDQSDERLLSAFNPVNELISALEKFPHTVEYTEKANQIMQALPEFMVKRAKGFKLKEQLKFLDQLVFEIYNLGSSFEHYKHELQRQYCLGLAQIDIYDFFLQLPNFRKQDNFFNSDCVRQTQDIAEYLHRTAKKQLELQDFKKLPIEQKNKLEHLYKETRLCRFINLGLPAEDSSEAAQHNPPTFHSWITADSDAIQIKARAEMARRLCEYWNTHHLEPQELLDLSHCGVTELPNDVNWARLLQLKADNSKDHFIFEREPIPLEEKSKKVPLNQLDLQGNKLTKLPPWFKDIRKECVLRLDGNPLREEAAASALTLVRRRPVENSTNHTNTRIPNSTSGSIMDRPRPRREFEPSDPPPPYSSIVKTDP
jgi:hypothetical protein